MAAMDFEAVKRFHQSGLDAAVAVEKLHQESSRLERLITEEQKKLDALTSKITAETKVMEGIAVKKLELERDNNKAMILRSQLEHEVKQLTEQKTDLESGLASLKQRIGA